MLVACSGKEQVKKVHITQQEPQTEDPTDSTAEDSNSGSDVDKSENEDLSEAKQTDSDAESNDKNLVDIDIPTKSDNDDPVDSDYNAEPDADEVTIPDDEPLPFYCDRSLSRDFACNRDRQWNIIDIEMAEDRYNTTCYDGWGFDSEFLATYQSRVGALVLDNGNRACSGELISENLFITAAHCVGYTTTPAGSPNGLSVGANRIVGVDFTYQKNGITGETRHSIPSRKQIPFRIW